MPHKKIRGIEIAYDDIGSGETIVFIHGHPFNRSMWNYQLDHFKNNYRLILPDLRGYGESEISLPRVMPDEFALDIIHLLDELGAEKVILCGLSMGGQIVLELYRLIADRIKAIVIVDSDARGETKESYDKRLALAEFILKEGLVKYTDENIHQYIAAASVQNKPVYDHLYKMMTTTSPAGAAAAHRGRAERRDHVRILSRIGVPALIVVGSEDFFTPEPIAAIISNGIPGAVLQVIEGSGHLPNMENPALFNKVLADFLEGI